MNKPTHSPLPIVSAWLLAACTALSACNRTDPPAGEQPSAEARQAASAPDAIAVPPPPQASEPASASRPQSSASPTASPVTTADADQQAQPAPAALTASEPVAPPADTPVAANGSPAASTPVAGDASASATAGASGAALYKVVDGYKVDAATMEGFRTWRAAACDRCHGANQEGMVGPSLIESMKVRDKAYFVDTLTNGRLAKGMPSFKTSTMVMENMDELYAYLKGRSDGAITQAKVQPME